MTATNMIGALIFRFAWFGIGLALIVKYQEFVRSEEYIMTILAAAYCGLSAIATLIYSEFNYW